MTDTVGLPWNLGIPSAHRSDIISSKTLRYLADSGVARERVFVFCTHDEIATYVTQIDPGLVAAVIPHDAVASVAGAHNAINAALGPGPVAHMDDDIKSIDELVATHLEPVKDLSAVIDDAFARCERLNATLWGIYPVHNAFYMKQRVNIGLTLCIGHLFGQILSGRPGEVTHLDVKNDYERSLQHFMMDGFVVRMEWLAADTRVYFGAGGMQDTRTPENAEEAVQELMRRYPGLVRRKSVESPFPEIALVNRRR